MDDSAIRRRPPYRQLHIYYIKGRVGDDRDLRDASYIGTWQEDDDAFCFFSRPADGRIQDLTNARRDLVLADRFQMSYDQWHGGGVAAYSAGPLFIKPPWDPAPPPPGKTCLLMDPGVVFGTGTHPTTRDCLEALQLAFDAGPVGRVLDLGTGTGLLALAAAGLGAQKVVAVDFNWLAARTALNNVHLNGLDDRIVVVQGDAKNFMDLACDVVVSNIHYAVMRPMIENQAFAVHKHIILSGLLRSQAREIETLLSRRSVDILGRWDQDGTWFTFWGVPN